MIFKPITLLLLLLLNITIGSSQNSRKFEGIVQYSTTITVTDSANVSRLKQLQSKYGDSLNIYYSRQGDVLRVYLNSGESGNEYQLYHPNADYLLIKKKQENLDTLDVSRNSVSLVSKSKFKETIMGVDCKCMHYRTVSNGNPYRITYCYSNKTPKVSWNTYGGYVDFFMKEYFRKAKRPYLKFKIEAIDFSLTYTATGLKQFKLEDRLFKR